MQVSKGILLKKKNFLTNKEILCKLYHFLNVFLSSPLWVFCHFDFLPLSLRPCLWLLAKVSCFSPPPFETGSFTMHH